MPAWPGTLPQCTQHNGYVETKDDGILRTSTDIGPQKRRKRTNAVVTNLSVSWVMTAAQLATLESFFQSTIQAGSLAFDFPHPRLGGTVSAVFAGPYSIAPHGQGWAVSASLEIQP